MGTRVAVDGREDEFCLSCIISMSRNSTREFFIAQTNRKIAIFSVIRQFFTHLADFRLQSRFKMD